MLSQCSKQGSDTAACAVFQCMMTSLLLWSFSIVERHSVSCNKQQSTKNEVDPKRKPISIEKQTEIVCPSVRTGRSMLPALALVRAALRTKSAIYRLFTVRAEPAAESTVCCCNCKAVCPSQLLLLSADSDDAKGHRHTTQTSMCTYICTDELHQMQAETPYHCSQNEEHTKSYTQKFIEARQPSAVHG